MNKHLRYLVIGLFVMLITIPLGVMWLTQEPEIQQDHRQNEQRTDEHYSSNVPPRMRSQVMVEDLSLTTSMFIQQLDQQLQKWTEANLTEAMMKEDVEQEVLEHPHFQAVGTIENGEMIFSAGDFSDEPLTPIEDMMGDHNEMIYTEPFSVDGDQYMRIAKKNTNNEWVLGEVNLSFIKQFVGNMASVADANGNFFITAEDTQINWDEDGKVPDDVISEAVPELGWRIMVDSKSNPSTPKEHFQEGAAVVHFENTAKKNRWLADHPQFHYKKNNSPYLIISHPSMSTMEIMEEVNNDDGVVGVEPNYIFIKQETTFPAQQDETDIPLPNDEFYEPYQWNLNQIRAEIGWEISVGGEDVIIAVLDTGIDPNHQDLSEKVIEGYNAFDGTNDVSDHNGHGTHVAGIAAAVTNNVNGIAGVSWHNPIMPIKVLNEDGEGSLYEIASGIRWAVDHGAQVINMSLGDHHNAELLYDAVRYAYDHDVLMIAASGNDNVNTPMYPAAYDEVLAVSATNQGNQKAFFSNFGDYIDISAPGEHIPSTFLEDQYAFMSGTSMAAPHVSGLAGLVSAIREDLSQEDIMQVIRQTASDLGGVGYDPYYGYGLIDVSGALELIDQYEDITFLYDLESEHLHDEDAQSFGSERTFYGWWINMMKRLQE